MKDRVSNHMSQKTMGCNVIAFRGPNNKISYVSQMDCQRGEIITFIIKCGMKLLIHSQTLTVQLQCR